MAHVSIYDTSVKASAGTGDQNNGPTPYPPVNAGETLTLQPTQTDFAEYITGEIVTEKAGTLKVEASFDYPRDHEDEAVALEDAHWAVIQAVEEPASKGEYKVEAKGSHTFILFAIAPYFRLVWTQAAATKEETEAIEKEEKEAKEAKEARETTEKTERETWETEETAKTITKVEREAKETAQTKTRHEDEATEKVAKEKREAELKTKGINKGLYLFARAQEKGRV